jgi:VRR-NUC domain-containing protein
MTTQLERSLQTEILYRLNRYPVVAIPVPNGIWLPAHNEAERVVVARLMARMKSDGMLLPGSPDLVIAGERRCVMVELKRPASRDLFGRKPKGRLSPEQKAFQQRCIDAGVEYTVASSWEDIAAVLPELY